MSAPEQLMRATVRYMSMSLDGFIAGPNARPGQGLGEGGERPRGRDDAFRLAHEVAGDQGGVTHRHYRVHR